MVTQGSTLGWHVPGVPCCLKIYIVTNFFLRLALVLQFYSTLFVYSLVFHLRPIGRTPIFILCYFTIKPPVHRRMKGRRIPHLRNFTFRLCLTLISLSHPSTASSIIVPLRAPLPKLHPTSLYFTLRRPVSPSIALHRVKSDSFRNPPYSLYLLFLIGC